ncbi:MAG TPA: DoxX family protein [Puia sp.]|nr:DoxX family protein [Puia sp.]
MSISHRHMIAPLLLRLIIGPGFMVHGWAKISRGTGGFEKLLAFEGVPLAHLSAVIAPYVELFGGLAILAGAYVVITAIPLLLTMLVATVFVQGHYGFSSVKTIGLTSDGPQFGAPCIEINLLYIAALLSLILTRAGTLSIDKWRQRRHG